MKFSICLLLFVAFATQLLVNAEEENAETTAQTGENNNANNPEDTSVAVVEDGNEKEKNCTKIVYVISPPPPKFFLFEIPEVACLANIVQLVLALPLKALDYAFLSVMIYNVGFFVVGKLADKHLQVAGLLETVGMGLNNVLSSAVGGVFGLVGLGEVAKVPLKLVSQATDLGLGIVSNTVGRVPIVGNILTTGLGIMSSPFRG